MKRTRLSRGQSLTRLLTRLDALSREDRSLLARGEEDRRPFFNRIVLFSVLCLYAKLRYYDDRSVTPFPPDSCLEGPAKIMCYSRTASCEITKPKLITVSMKSVSRVIEPAHCHVRITIDEALFVTR